MLPPRPEDSDFGNGAPVITSSGNGTGGDLVPVQQEPVYLPAPSWPVGPTRPEILTAGPDPVSLLYAIKRRWFVATVSGLAAAAVMAMAALWFWPETYGVVALLRVSRDTGSMISTPGSRQTPQAYESNLRTHVSLLKGEFVLIAALRDPSISQLPLVRAESDKVGWLQDELSIDNPRESELLRVSMRGEDPAQLVKIIDAVIEKYFTEHVDVERQEKLRKLTRLEDTMDRKREQLRRENSKLQGLYNQIGPGGENWQTLRTFMMEHVRHMEYARRILIGDLRKTNAEIQKSELDKQRALDSGMSEYQLRTELMKDPDYVLLRKQAQEASETLDGLEAALKNPQNNSSWLSAKGKLDAIGEKLEVKRQELEPLIRDAVNDFERFNNELAVLETLKESMETELAELEPKIKEDSDTLRKIGQTSPEIKALEAQIENLRRFISQNSPQVDSLRFEMESPPAVQKVQEATPPESSNWLQRYLMVGFSSVAGFIMAVFGVAIWEFQSRRVNTTEQIAEGLGLRLVGTLPVLSARRGLLSVGQNHRDTLKSMLTESIDGVRATLIHNANGSPHQVVLVTSAMDQEGKTTVASQLAVSLARSGRRTLLVDADLRNPTGHRLFELSLEDGLSEVLRGRADLDDVIRPTRSAGLWMVSAGRCDLESLQELARGRLQSIFDELKPQFDFIVVDSAPVLTVADTLIVGQAADAVVLSVLRGVSRMPKVYEANERLESVGIRIMGVIVNGAATTSHRRMYDLPLPASA